MVLNTVLSKLLSKKENFTSAAGTPDFQNNCAEAPVASASYPNNCWGDSAFRICGGEDRQNATELYHYIQNNFRDANNDYINNGVDAKNAYDTLVSLKNELGQCPTVNQLNERIVRQNIENIEIPLAQDTTNSSGYYLTEELGKCPSNDAITSGDECRLASEALKNSIMPSVIGYEMEVNESNRTPGCFYDKYPKFFFNSDSSSTGRWGWNVCKVGGSAPAPTVGAPVSQGRPANRQSSQKDLKSSEGKKDKKSNKGTVIAIIIVIILFFVGGAYFIMRKNK